MRKEMLDLEIKVKGNLKPEMQSFNIIFKNISEEFKKNIGKEKFDKSSVQLLENLWNSLKSKIKQKQDKINLNEWVSKNDLNKTINLFNFNVSDLKLNLKKLIFLVQELIDLLNNNFDIVMSECKKFNKVYLPSTIDLITILKNYTKFRNEENFSKTWYSKVIFKELFSNLDKIIVDYSLIKTKENFIFNKSEIIECLFNEKLSLFKMMVWEKKIDKWKIVVLEKFDSKQNILSFKTLENKLLKEIENDKMWVTLKIHRDKFEHSWADFFLDNIFNEMNTNFTYFIVYLISLNIYLLDNIWNMD